jgi:hypothetical protein
MPCFRNTCFLLPGRDEVWAPQIELASRCIEDHVGRFGTTLPIVVVVMDCFALDKTPPPRAVRARCRTCDKIHRLGSSTSSCVRQAPEPFQNPRSGNATRVLLLVRRRRRQRRALQASFGHLGGTRPNSLCGRLPIGAPPRRRTDRHPSRNSSCCSLRERCTVAGHVLRRRTSPATPSLTASSSGRYRCRRSSLDDTSFL